MTKVLILLALSTTLLSCDTTPKEGRHYMKGVVTEVGGCTRDYCGFTADFYGTEYVGTSSFWGVARGQVVYKACWYEGDVRWCNKAQTYLPKSWGKEWGPERP